MKASQRVMIAALMNGNSGREHATPRSSTANCRHNFACATPANQDLHMLVRHCCRICWGVNWNAPRRLCGRVLWPARIRDYSHTNREAQKRKYPRLPLGRAKRFSRSLLHGLDCNGGPRRNERDCPRQSRHWLSTGADCSLSGLQLLEVISSYCSLRPRFQFADRAPIGPDLPASDSADCHSCDLNCVRNRGVIQFALGHVIREVHPFLYTGRTIGVKPLVRPAMFIW
jgi:hypothetical protein